MKGTTERLSTFVTAVVRQSSHLTDPRVIAAMKTVDRALFVPPEYRSHAYDVAVISLDGYTLSEPGLVGFMIQSLGLKQTDAVLDVGSGSGYHAAIMSRLCSAVYGVEVLPHAVERSRTALRESNCGNVSILCADGWDGWPEHAPYDAINVACAANYLPPTLLRQLKVGGRIIIPVNAEDDSGFPSQDLCLITKKANAPLDEHEIPPIVTQRLSPVRFVPMVHAHH